MAKIESSGAFSNYPGYQRLISILTGPGIDLQFLNHSYEIKTFDIFQFDGADECTCRLINGAVQDFNFIWNPKKIKITWGLYLPETGVAQDQISTYSLTLIFVIQGSICLLGQKLSQYDGLLIEKNEIESWYSESSDTKLIKINITIH